MAQVTWTVNKDATTADNGTSLGCGAQDYLPVGNYSGYNYRAMLNFSYGNFSQIASVQSAILWMKTSDQAKVAFGSSPSIDLYRIVTAFIEGTNTSLSASPSPSGAVERSNEGSTSFHAGPFGVSTTQNKWVSFDITAMVANMVANNYFVGFQIRATTTGTGDVTEFWSREGGAAPYIVVTYTPPVTNVAPNPPTGLGVTAALAPTFVFDHSDPDGDALLNYDIQVSSDASFNSVTHWNASSAVGGISGNHVSVGYGGSALSRGVTYYWRAQTRSATGILTASGWTVGSSWRVPQLPTVSLVSPSSNGAAVEMSYVVGSGLPKAVIRWSFSDPEGGAQQFYQVLIQNDAGTTTVRDTGKTSGNALSYTVPDNLTRNTNYRVTVTVWNSGGDSAVVSFVQFRPQWAVVEYRIDLLGTVTSWSPSAASSAPANTAVVTEYASSAAGGAIGTWYASLASAALARWFHYRVWLFAWSGAATPSLTRMSLAYSSDVGVPPDGWTITAQHAIDSSTRVYGTQSLRVTCNGTTLAASQLIKVQKNTDYVLSGRIKSDGNSGAFLAISNGAVTGAIVASTPLVATAEFTRVNTVVWNSGDSEEIYIVCRVSGATGTKAWFDALKMEASRVVTSWNPGLVGSGLSVDAGGIKVDASIDGGATFRLQGSDGLARSTVELGTKGLLFAGDTLLHSPAAGTLAVGDDAVAAGVLSLSGGPGAGGEGGQLDVLGKGADTDWHIDNLNGGLRFFDTAVRMAISSTNPVVSVTGALTASGEINAGEFRPAVGIWHRSNDGRNRWNFTNAGRTYFGSQNGYEFRSAADGAIATLGNGGDFNAAQIQEGGVRLIQPAGLRIQYGTWSIPANAGNAAVTFSPAFSAAPAFVSSLNSNSRGYLMVNGAVSATTGNVVVLLLSGAIPTIALNGTWIAIGPA